MINRKKIFTKKKVTGVAALFVALAIIITGTFAWKDFSQSALSLFSADATPKHWVSLVDDFQSATDASTNTLTNWKRGDTSIKQIYISSKLTNTKANPSGIIPDPEDVYDSVYVRVMLEQELTIGGGEVIADSKANPNSINQYPSYVKWNDNDTIKTIDEWVNEESQQQGAYWILDNATGWLYWAQPLEFGEETEHLLDTVELLVEPEKALEYTVDVTLQAVSSDLDSTTGTDEYLGGFKDWGIASTAKILPLFIETFEFTIDTTLTPDNQTFTPQVFANADNDFAVDWGDGTALDARTNDNRNTAHTYATNGEYIVKIIGTMPSAMTFNGNQKLISIQSGLLENTASTMQEYFCNCTNLKAIPSSLFAKSTAVTNFQGIFKNCTSLTGSIPAELFKNNTVVTTFRSSFYNCRNLDSIPTNLFETNTMVTTFEGTFIGCTGLTSIPVELFKANTEVTNFLATFSGCSGIISIPAGLFDYNPSVTEFDYAFQNCTAITSSLPTLWVSHSLATHTNTFMGCMDAENYDEALAEGWATE